MSRTQQAWRPIPDPDPHAPPIVNRDAIVSAVIENETALNDRWGPGSAREGASVFFRTKWDTQVGKFWFAAGSGSLVDLSAQAAAYLRAIALLDADTIATGRVPYETAEPRLPLSEDDGINPDDEIPF